ncbi:multicopper oxidase family protein [Nocardioides insulae]|uniref:multicopper oxidase family protein n=1 Tax=Nocardioides insulae TaxID=394734 RepID=UPI0003F4D414|nr:multicopper oxidase domain-containing protein [Nocardioides insulae]
MRTFLKLFAAVAALGVLAVAGFAGYLGWSYFTSDIDTVGQVEFDRAVAIPPLADSRVAPDGTRVFDLTMQAGETDLGQGAPTPTWGFEGSYLGPTLRAEVGEKVRIDVHNELPETSTVHWHGMHLPAAMDGGPHQPIAPGDTWSPHWRIDQQPATLWYHPHPHGETARHVYRGLAGLFYLDDPDGPTLPSTYGVDDVPLVVQDKQFDGHELDESPGLFQSGGVLGDTVLVNGTPGPYLEVSTRLIRLRVLNASNTRTYHFVFDDERTFDLIASDGGLLPAPTRLTELTLSPAERAEIVVRMKPRERTVLRSLETPGDNNPWSGGQDRLDVIELRAADSLTSSPDLPARLAEPPDRADDEIVATREFRLTGSAINGVDMDMSRIDLAAEVDTTERWVVRNPDGNPHNFHVHDVQFQISSYDGAEPPPELAGWKDTVWLPPGTDAELLVRFEDYTDPNLPYMFHCHVLRHEDDGMMGQFVVVRPGQQPGAPPTHHH